MADLLVAATRVGSLCVHQMRLAVALRLTDVLEVDAVALLAARRALFEQSKGRRLKGIGPGEELLRCVLQLLDGTPTAMALQVLNRALRALENPVLERARSVAHAIKLEERLKDRL